MCNLKPFYVVGWRNVDNVKRRGEGIIQQLDDLFAEIKDSRPSDSSVIAGS